MQSPNATTPLPFAPHDPLLEQDTRETGLALLALMDKHPEPGILSTKGAHARLMEWALRDPEFKTGLFRFVDVLPVLHDPRDVLQHLHEYLGDRTEALGFAIKAGLAATQAAPTLAATMIRSQVGAMAAHFVAGETPTELVKRFRANAKAGIATTVDLLGEAVLTEQEADAFLRRNLEVLQALVEETTHHNEPCASDLGPGGRTLPRINLSVKMSALAPDLNPLAPARSIGRMLERLRPLLKAAAKAGAFVNIDMESTRLKDLTLALFHALLDDPEFTHTPQLGIALQAYLRDSERDLRDLLAKAKRQGRQIGVRLVKGAYWDSETLLAAQRGWPCPVWERKEDSDANFERLTEILLRAGETVLPAFATHNVRSCAFAAALAKRLAIDPARLEFQALYGMADDLKHGLRARGWRVREYCAIGALLPGMAYLVRRLLENTSNESFLRTRAAGADAESLLAAPTTRRAQPTQEPAHLPPVDRPGWAPGSRFRNAPNTDFTLARQREALEAALGDARLALPIACPLLIGGRTVETPAKVSSTNPAHPGVAVAHASVAGSAQVEEAIAEARKAQPAWQRVPATTRCDILERAGGLLERRRHALSALLILEGGKTWLEADAEVSEAVDFCRYYAARMRELAPAVRTQEVGGEDCSTLWQARGVAAVIAPWNFPLAILCGMAAAPLVAGNAVVLKPSSLTPAIAQALVQVLLEAGVPGGALSLLHGPGGEIGARLAASPHVHVIAFTGSRAVGCALWQAAGQVPPSQLHLKHVVCEMGGKNALVIDADADLDEAIPAIIQSAFSHAGQKCSALSRLIVHEAVHDALVARLTEACATLVIGDPAEPATQIGPVIDAAAHTRILACIEMGKTEAKLHWQGKVPAEAAEAGGHYLAPVIFTEVKPGHRLACEEIFGPVLAVLKAASLDEALALANDSEYALTGGLFSRSPVALRRAREEMDVGNLYLNRAITGALVERHPFGGHRLSGGGTKAGGRGYLENFLVQRTIVECTLRRGFAPPRT